MEREEKMSSGKVQKLVGSYTFRIDRFSGLSSNVGASTESPEFDLCGHIWQLRIFPGGSLEAHKGHLSYYLASKSSRQARASYRLSVLNQYDDIATGLNTTTATSNTTTTATSRDESFSSSGVRVFEAKGLQVDGWGRDKFMTVAALLDPTAGFCVDDNVIFRVLITVYGVLEICSFPVMSNASSIGTYASLSKNMHSLLLEDSDSYDITLIVGKSRERIHAHRCILSARSPVFEAMLATGGPPSIVKRRSQHTENILLRERIHALENDNETLREGNENLLMRLQELDKSKRKHGYNTRSRRMDTLPAESKECLPARHALFASSTTRNNSESPIFFTASTRTSSSEGSSAPGVTWSPSGVRNSFRSMTLEVQQDTDSTQTGRGNKSRKLSASNHNDNSSSSCSYNSSGNGSISDSQDETETKYSEEDGYSSGGSDDVLYLGATFKEGRRSEVVIDDVEPAAMRELLLFMYTDACSNVNVLSENAVELLAASSKYQVSTLFAFIEVYLTMEVTPTSCLSLLQLADTFDAPKLWTKTLATANDNALLETPEFAALPRQLRGLVQEALGSQARESTSGTAGSTSGATMSVESVPSAGLYDTGNEGGVDNTRGQNTPNRICTIF